MRELLLVVPCFNEMEHGIEAHDQVNIDGFDNDLGNKDERHIGSARPVSRVRIVVIESAADHSKEDGAQCESDPESAFFILQVIPSNQYMNGKDGGCESDGNNDDGIDKIALVFIADGGIAEPLVREVQEPECD